MSFVTSILACCVCLADADAFLKSKPAEQSAFIDAEDLKHSLLQQLARPSSIARLSDVEEHLLPLYTALPKGGHGKLEPTTVRYALHRYFVQRHSWYMNGLEAGYESDSRSASIMKDRAPIFIQNLFDDQSQGQGVGLRELTVFASVLTDLVHAEAAGGLHGVFVAMQLPTTGQVGRQDWKRAIKAYIVQYLLGSSVMVALSERSMDEAAVEQFLGRAYPAWTQTYTYVQDCHAVDDMAQLSHRNPFVETEYSFDDAVRFVQEFGHNFGSFQNHECKAMKSQLLEMETAGTGRVPLSRFYASGMDGKFAFKERDEYLRHLHALDESDPKRPSVVIPNYLTSASNCLTSSGFYAVCCVDECDGLMSHLEVEIAGPLARPTRIIELVSGMSSETVEAPRNVSATLVSRLVGIADLHGGQVPLHGRLFAQWMHHAYPRECRFPHVGMVAKPLVPEQYFAAYGSVTATRETMQEHAEAIEHAEVAPVDMPWSDVEELLSDEFQRPSSRAQVFLRLVVACAVLVSFAIPLVRTAASCSPKSSGAKVEKCLV